MSTQGQIIQAHYNHADVRYRFMAAGRAWTGTGSAYVHGTAAPLDVYMLVEVFYSPRDPSCNTLTQPSPGDWKGWMAGHFLVESVVATFFLALLARGTGRLRADPRFA